MHVHVRVHEQGVCSQLQCMHVRMYVHDCAYAHSHSCAAMHVCAYVFG